MAHHQTRHGPCSPAIGVLSLDTRFPRVLGDLGNPDSYPFEARIKTVEGADSRLVVQDRSPDDALLRRFDAAARDLQAEGVAAIVSTCGFLATSQARIAAAVRVPVLLSALSLCPLIRRSCPGRIGILTASRSALGPRMLAAAELDRETLAIAGFEDVPAFAQTFLVTRAQQPSVFDRTAIEAAVVGRAVALQKAHGDLGAIVMECGNLPPYADAVRNATGLPVFHLLDAAIMLVAAGGGTGQSA